jgi:hypothetical protein
MGSADANRPQPDVELRARLAQCFKVVTSATVAPPALRALESVLITKPNPPRPASGATFVSIAIDAHLMSTPLPNTQDCERQPGAYGPCKDPATPRPVQVDSHALLLYGPTNALVANPFQLTWAPVARAIVNGDPRFSMRMDPRETLRQLVALDLDKEGDEVRFAAILDRAVLAFQTRDARGSKFLSELDTWLAAHPTSFDLVATRATLASLARGDLVSTDPCTAPAIAK